MIKAANATQPAHVGINKELHIAESNKKSQEDELANILEHSENKKDSIEIEDEKRCLYESDESDNEYTDSDDN